MHYSMAEIKHPTGLTIHTARQAQMPDARGREKQFWKYEASYNQGESHRNPKGGKQKKEENWIWIVNINVNTI